MKNKSPKGILADPMLRPMGRTSIGKVQIYGMMIALLDHYDIPGGFDDPDAAFLLAFMLTRDHVVRPASTRRPPKKPAHRPHDLAVGLRDLHMFKELERARRDQDRFVRQAADELAKRWREEGKCDWSGESLRQRYYQIRKSGEAKKGIRIAAIKETKSRSASKI